MIPLKIKRKDMAQIMGLVLPLFVQITIAVCYPLYVGSKSLFKIF